MPISLLDGLSTLERPVLTSLSRVAPDSAQTSTRVLSDALGIAAPESVDNQLRLLASRYGQGELAHFLPPEDTGTLGSYLALARFAQPWLTRYPLADGLGNWGSSSGDMPADHFYTKIAGSAYARDIMLPNIASARLPNLLLNGATGQNPETMGFPPHNLREVSKVLRDLLAEPGLSSEAVARSLPGPDFPTGGSILDSSERIAELYLSGRGSLTLRGTCHTEPWRAGRQALVVTEMPYRVALDTWIMHVADSITNGELSGVLDIQDHSDFNGLRIALVLAPDTSPDEVREYLCACTAFEQTLTVELYAELHGESTVWSLEQALQAWLEHRMNTINADLLSNEITALTQTYGDERRTRLSH